jgi:3-methylcrotonyl-CoA carboxylase alpha subunit
MRIRNGERAHQASLRRSGEERLVTLDGALFRIALQQVSPATFVLQDGPRRETFHCVRDGSAIHLFWRGAAYTLVEERELPRGAQRHHASGLTAPMPGRVIAVKASPGQELAKGDEILIVEAMKMENAIRAPRAGRLKAIAVKLGDMVAPGTVLAELEDLD